MHSPKLFVRTFTIWWFICACLTMVANAQDKTTVQAPKQLVFTVLPSANGVSFRVNNTREPDPLRGLGMAVEKYGDELPVVCFIDSRLPVRLIAEASALAGKAGFKNVRTFALDHSTGKVSEVKLGPWRSMPQ
jgi:hypothetical protein